MSEERVSRQETRMSESGLQPWSNSKIKKGPGLKIEAHFSTPGVHPFEQIEWEARTAKITDENGKAIFEQKDGLRRRRAALRRA